jgi:hypothetical protein
MEWVTNNISSQTVVYYELLQGFFYEQGVCPSQTRDTHARHILGPRCVFVQVYTSFGVFFAPEHCRRRLIDLMIDARDYGMWNVVPVLQ